MALVNKVWRESDFVPYGAEPGLVTSRSFVENVQNEAVVAIAGQRFPYPTTAEPALKSYRNRPEHTVGVRAPNGDLLFPDIVVMNTASTEVQMLGEVETIRSLRATDVTDKWRAFAGAGQLYLFVPYSQIARARSLLKPLELKLSGLRSWRMNMGQGTVDTLDLPV